MVHGRFLSCIPFIAVISIVSGYNNYAPSPPHQQRYNPYNDYHRPPPQQMQPSRNIKRMTMDENARSRDAWGQMSSQQQFYQNPYQRQQHQQQQPQNHYYQPIPGSGGNFFSSTEPTGNGGAVINIFKPMMPGQGPGQEQGQGQEEKPQRDEVAPSKRMGAFTMKKSARMPVREESQNIPNPTNKKVKVLICRLQGQA